MNKWTEEKADHATLIAAKRGNCQFDVKDRDQSDLAGDPVVEAESMKNEYAELSRGVDALVSAKVASVFDAEISHFTNANKAEPRNT